MCAALDLVDPSVPDYAKLADRARTLIQEFGRRVTFVRFSEQVQDVTKPWRGASDPRQSLAEEFETSAVFVEPSSATQLGMQTAVLDLLARSKQILIVAPGASLERELEEFQEVIDSDDSRWKVMGLEKLRPAETTLLYFVGVAR